MPVIFAAISLVLSFVSGFVSGLIYTIVIKKTLAQSNSKFPPPDWLPPFKHKALIEEYNQIVKGRE